MNIRYLSLLLLSFLMIGCENMNELPTAPNASVGLSVYKVGVDGNFIDVVVTSTNEISVVEKPEWITEDEKVVSGNNHIFTFEVKSNISLNERNGEIKFNTGGKESTVTVMQESYPIYEPSNSLLGLEGKVEKMELETVATEGGIAIKGKTDKPRSGSPFYRVYDGTVTNSDVFYSKEYLLVDGIAPADAFPVRMDLYLPENTYSIDHVLYYATKNNQLGAWGEVELWVSTSVESREDYTETLFTKIGEKNCEFRWTSGKSLEMPIPANEKVSGVRTVRIIAKSAFITTTVRVAAQELEVYGIAPLTFDTSELFTDNSCSALKEGVTADFIADYAYPIFQNVAHYLNLGLYSPKRILDISEATTTETSIRTIESEDLVVMAEGAEKTKVTIQILNASGDGVLATYPLTSYANVFKKCKMGRIQVLYTGTTPVKLNFLSGEEIE